MTSINNNVGVPMQAYGVQQKQSSYQTPVNFKAGRDEFVRSDEMSRLMAERQKQQKKAEREQKGMKWLQVGALISSIALAGFFIWQGTKGRKNVAKDAVDETKEQLKALTGFDLKLTDLKGSKKVAGINSETTNTGIRKFFQETINSSGELTDAAKKYANSEDVSQAIYMYGHGGTGKTYGAKQIAQELDALFASVKCSELASPYKDAASMKVTAFFDSIVDAANKNPNRKLVVCIDEFDSILKLPGAGGDKDADKVRSALLPGIEAVTEKCKNVIFVATSNYSPNHPQIDSAALTRFLRLKMELPDVTQAKALLKMYMGQGDYIDPKVFESKAFEDFAQKLVDGKYSSREIEKMASAGKKAFESSLKGVKDADLSLHKYTVDFLEEGKKKIGDAAAKSDILIID